MLNTAVCEVEVVGRKGTVLRFNDASHLKEEKVVVGNADATVG
jgi:hypothetical protein